MAEVPIVAEIIAAFDGPTRLAEALKEPVSTVHAWTYSKRGIPRWRRPQILSAAEADGKPLPPHVVEYLNSTEREAA